MMNRNHTPRTFGATVRYAVVRTVLIVGLVALYPLTMSLVSGGTEGYLNTAPLTSEAQDVLDGNTVAAPGTPGALIAEHNCWTGAAPAKWVGKIPAGVVVTEGTRLRHATDNATIGRALDSIFGEAQPGMTVHGFCAR